MTENRWSDDRPSTFPLGRGAECAIITSMRVIAGRYKGRRLSCPKGQRIRPIPDRLKEALFNILGREVEGTRVLDLCAGTGAMGIEALSRGATWVTFVDSWRPAIECIKHNVRVCGIDSGYEILGRDVRIALVRLSLRGESFHLVFFDPPYASPLYDDVLDALGRGSLVKPGGRVLVMHHAKRRLHPQYGRLRHHREVKQGENILSFYISD